MEQIIEKNGLVEQLKMTNKNLSEDVKRKLEMISDLKNQFENGNRASRARDETERLLLQETKLRQDTEKELQKTCDALHKSIDDFKNYRE